MTRFYRIAHLAKTSKSEGLIGVTAATLWRWVKSGHFPAPIKLGANTTAFDAEAVQGWIAERLSGQSASKSGHVGGAK